MRGGCFCTVRTQLFFLLRNKASRLSFGSLATQEPKGGRIPQSVGLSQMGRTEGRLEARLLCLTPVCRKGAGGLFPSVFCPLCPSTLHPAAYGGRTADSSALFKNKIHPKETRKHKEKCLVQSSDSYFLDVKGPGCYKIPAVLLAWWLS